MELLIVLALLLALDVAAIFGGADSRSTQVEHRDHRPWWAVHQWPADQDR